MSAIVIEEERQLQQEMRADEAKRQEFLKYAATEGIGRCTSAKEAEKIMDQNFFGVFSAIRFMDAQYAPEELVRLSVVPFSEKVLRACRTTHILFAGCKMDLVDIRQKMMAKLWMGRRAYRGDFSYDGEAYAGPEKGVRAEWYLIRRSVLPGSFVKTYGEQEMMMDLAYEQRPSAAELAYMIAIHMMAKLKPLLDANGQCAHKLDLFTFNKVVTSSLLFESCVVWARGRDSRGCAPYVGFTEVHKGVGIGNAPPARRQPNIGLAPSVKQTL